MAQTALLLVALNARYIHTNPAVRSLARYCAEAAPVECVEFALDQPIDRMLAAIVRRRPAAVAFSCYLWNIDRVLILAESAAKVLPGRPILLGGPEVSFDAQSLLEKAPFVDAVIRGEGEETLRQWLLYRLNHSGDFPPIAGMTCRTGDAIVQGPDREPVPMDDLPFPYEDPASFINRILYYESSRGCPFRCAYCLSAAGGPVRFRSVERVEEELETFMAAGVHQVKLVDRTFNCDPARARRIFGHLITLHDRYRPRRPVNFHFELSVALLDEETLYLLRQAPPGLIQFEIGVQSTHGPTLDAVGRREPFETLRGPVESLIGTTAVPVHLDLIAGMPHEGLAAFSHSFDDTYRLGPGRLQLGFLKLLKGAPLRERAGELGLLFADRPPYEILSTPDLAFEELSELKDIEELVERLYNSRHMVHTMARWTDGSGSPFECYRRMARWWRQAGHFDRAHSIAEEFELLWEYLSALPHGDGPRLRSLLRFDWLLLEYPRRTPLGLSSPDPPRWKQRIRAFFADEDNVRRLLPHHRDRSVQQIMRMCRIEAFTPPVHDGHGDETEYILFDYQAPTPDRRAVHTVTL